MHVYNRGFLGNRLLQHSVALLIGKRLHQDVDTLRMGDLRENSDEIIENTLLHNFLQNGKSYVKTKLWTREDEEDSQETVVNEQNFLDILSNPNKYINCTVTTVGGFFQSKEFVLNYKDEIRELFGSAENEPPIDGVFAHFRLKDRLEYTYEDCLHLKEYFYEAFSTIPNLDIMTKKYISSDSPEHPLIQGLISEFNLTLCQMSAYQTLSFGARFSHKILSWGSFSWWIGFLNNQNHIIYPDQKRILNKWYGDIYVFDEWHKV